MILGYLFAIAFLAIMAGLFTFVLSVNLLFDKFPSYEHPAHMTLSLLAAIFVFGGGLFLVIS